MKSCEVRTFSSWGWLMASRGSCRPLTGSIHRVLARKIYKRKAGASALWLRGISTGGGPRQFQRSGDDGRCGSGPRRRYSTARSSDIRECRGAWLGGGSGNFRKAPFLNLARDTVFSKFRAFRCIARVIVTFRL